MSEFTFSKWQGCGNDFVLVNCFKEIPDFLNSDEKISELSKRVCDRHYGIGGDGLILILPSEKADLKMRIFNTDGSEAEMCGNGIRCFAKCAYVEGLVAKEEFTVETGAGILSPKLLSDDGKITNIRVDMGCPELNAPNIPIEGYGDGQVVSQPITVLNQEYTFTGVSMGNPHCVVFVDNINALPIESVGPVFETHEAFPRKINTEFVQVVDKEHLRMRVWERGASVTLACGTGACATLTAAVLNGFSDRKAEIQLDGGILTVEWADNNHLFMTGPAECVFKGQYEI